MSYSSVRLAFDGSVACTPPSGPPVRRQRIQLSTVPNARSASAVDAAFGEQPLELGGREVGVEHEPGALADERLVACGPELVATRRRAPVLPHDGAVQRLARAPVPHDGGLALVGDADRGDRSRRRVGERRLHLGEGRERRRPDSSGVVLDPPRLGEVLRELAVRPRRGLAVLVDGERRGRRWCRRRSPGRRSPRRRRRTGRRGSRRRARVTSSRPDLAIPGAELEHEHRGRRSGSAPGVQRGEAGAPSRA